jgi:hypothetical protein
MFGSSEALQSPTDTQYGNTHGGPSAPCALRPVQRRQAAGCYFLESRWRRHTTAHLYFACILQVDARKLRAAGAHRAPKLGRSAGGSTHQKSATLPVRWAGDAPPCSYEPSVSHSCPGVALAC